MNIVVLVKQVPDTWAERKLDATDKTLDRASVDVVMNEIDEYAVEEALQIKEAQGGEVTIVTMGPDRAVETIRKALSMGADKAVHLVDDALARLRRDADVVRAGQGARHARVRPGHRRLRGHRLAHVGHGAAARRAPRPAAAVRRPQGHRRGRHRPHRAPDRERLRRRRGARRPAIVSVVEKINEPRYPSFKGIMAAKKKPLTTLTLADAGIEAEQVGLASAPSQVVDFANKPPRQAGQVVKDEGDGGAKIAEFLASQKLV